VFSQVPAAVQPFSVFRLVKKWLKRALF